ncbi:hypothetical protein [Streptosporangium amethystogenes]|uniref:hypothetical protein n=1 Tax=Streptosporangium amethystogenes TaxID=2002 RepID=UPI0012F90E97|nr:hypothetical protein [Streptosporangium amethystogenes]
MPGETSENGVAHADGEAEALLATQRPGLEAETVPYGEAVRVLRRPPYGKVRR